MKALVHIAVCAIIACMAVSCGNKADRASLVAIDSLIMLNPDSACELLAEYPADSLTTDDDRAYHALLTTIADYKAYRPATTDSAINIAVDHYDHGDAKTDKRMRSLLYKGCVMEELGDPEQAIEYYKCAESVCPDNDYFFKGCIEMRKAELYQRAFIDSIPIYTYKNALDNFRKAGSLHFESIMLNSIGSSYILSNTDSAEYYIKQSISFSKIANDSIATADGLVSMCSLYYSLESYKQVTKHAYETAVVYGRFLENRSINDIIAISFAKNNMIDSAYWYINHALPVKNISDSISMFRAKAEIAFAERDAYKYIHLNQIAVDLADSILIASQADKIREAEAKYDMAMMEVEHLSRQKKLTVIISVLSLVVIAVLFVVYVQRKRIATAKKENETAQIHLSALKIQIADSLKQIETLKKQQDTSPSEEQLGMLMQSIEGSLACYSSLLANVLKQTKTSSSEKNTKLASIMDEDFFAQLHLYLNLRYDNLIDKLAYGDYDLNNEEVNIICLELCRFPNPIQWAYSNCDRYKSLLNKKKIIANKVNGSQTIANIPQNI